MDATKRPLALSLSYDWSTHFSAWVIRDEDNHQIGQMDSEEKAHLIVTACNNFNEMLAILTFISCDSQIQHKLGKEGEDLINIIRVVLAKIKEK